MKVRLVVVPPGGGEADYSIFIEMPGVPSAGDYVGATIPGQTGGISLLVKRVWWTVQAADDKPYSEAGKESYGTTEEVAVECYVAKGPYDSDEHKRTVAMYEARGKPAPEFDASMY